MKKHKKVHAKKALKHKPKLSARWLHIFGLLLLVGLVSGTGVKLTLASFAGSAPPNGSLDIITYEGAANGGNEIGSVYVVTAAGGSGVNCSPSTGVTDPDGGGNHGHVHLTCPAASGGGPRQYRFMSASRDGYSFSGNSPHQPGGDFHIWGGQTTTLSLVLDRIPDPTPPPPSDPTPDPPPVVHPPSSTPNGTLDIVTYEGSANGGNELGGVYVVTGAGGSGVNCSPTTGVTDPNGGGNHGHVHLTCPAASDGGSRAYTFRSVTRDGYTISPSSPHHQGDDFHISGGNTTTLSIVLNRNPAPAPSPTPSTSSNPSSSPGSRPSTSDPATGGAAPSPTTVSARPADQLKGAVQVTTYVANADGTRTRVSGVNIHVQPVGFATTDSNVSCKDYNKTTDGGGTPATNSNYGQVHFTDCWTGSGGTKAYQLSYVQLPRGLSFKSLQLTGPADARFRSGSTITTTGVNEQFNVMNNQETRLEINLSQDGPAGVKEVVTQQGTRYVPAEGNQADKSGADALNVVSRNGSIDLNDIASATDDGEGDDSGDDVDPPSAPTNFRATLDESGSVNLSWDAAQGHPAGEDLIYYVSRFPTNSPDDVDDVGDPTISLTALDTADNLDHPQSYTYQVIAEDDTGNDSEPASVDIATQAPAPNVVAAPASSVSPVDSSSSSTTADDSSSDTSDTSDVATIVSDNGDATLSIPTDATKDDLSCTVSQSDSSGDEMLNDLGTVVGDTYTPVCSDDSGNTDNEFTDDADVTITADDSDIGSGTDLYGYDGTDWVQIPTDDTGSTTTNSTDDSKKPTTISYTSAQKSKFNSPTGKKSKTTPQTVYTVHTKKLFALALVKKHQSQLGSSLTPLTTIALMGLAIWGARQVIRRRLEQSFIPAHPYGDLDITATVPRPTQNQAKVYTADTPQPTVSTDDAYMVTPSQQGSSVVSPTKRKNDDR